MRSAERLRRVVVFMPEWHTRATGFVRRVDRERHASGSSASTRRVEVDISDRPAPTIQTGRGGCAWLVEAEREVGR